MSDIKFDGQFDEYVSFQADFGVVTSTAAVVDPTVTEDSPNPVASSGIYTFVKDEVSAEKTSRDAAIFAESQERMKGDEDIQRYVTSKIEAEESARSSADTDLANSISELSRNTVRTVNHIAPDPDGNVNVEGGSGLVDDVKVNGVSVVTDKVANVAVPTKVSSLENDAGYISQIPQIPTKLSQMTNDVGFTTTDYVDEEISKIPTPPTKTSQLTNDSGYITSADIPSIPTKTSELTNDSGFITSADVPDPYDDTEIREEISGLDDKIKDLELFKFPNVTIIGTPTINNGQISDFSATSYLKFPFLVDFRNQPFEINMAFTTGANVVQQENIFDSDYGLAFAIRNSRFVIAISTNGTSWDLGEGVGSLTVQPNTTYYIKIAWNGSQYVLYYSFDGVSYIPDITKAGTAQPYPKQIYIGVGENFASVVNHFGGTINLNNANLKVNGEVFWTGMDDAGISTRADVSLSNIDADGEAKIKEVAETDSIKASLANKIEDSALTPLRNNISILTSQMASKQNKLTAGTNIIIENDVISASGTVSAVDDVARAGVTEVKDTLNGLSDTVVEIKEYIGMGKPTGEKDITTTFTLTNARGIRFSDGAEVATSAMANYTVTEFIQVYDDTVVTYTSLVPKTIAILAQYDENKNFVGAIEGTSSTISGSYECSKGYIRMTFRTDRIEPRTVFATINYGNGALKIGMLGDSVTWGRIGGASGVQQTEKGIPYWVGEITKNTVDNLGVGSMGWISHQYLSTNAMEYVRTLDFSKYDFVTLAWGLNDGDIVLGNYTDTDGTTIMGAVFDVCNYIMTQNPKIQLILIAPTVGKASTFPYYNPNGQHTASDHWRFTDYFEQIKLFSEKYSIPLIMGNYCLNAWNRNLYIGDNVHPTEEGYKVVGRYIANQIKKYL